MAVTTKKTFNAVGASGQSSSTVFTPVSIQLNNQDDLDVYVTLSGGTRVLQLRQSTGSVVNSNHPQVNNTDGLYFPAVAVGTQLYNYQLSSDDNIITFNSALPNGAVVSCERRTRDESGTYTNFAAGSTIRAKDLNNSAQESNFTAQEARNKAFEIENAIFDGPVQSTGFVTSANIVDGSITGTDIASNTVTSSNITDGTIVDADVNASAAIQGTKISPNFGSQTVQTTGAANLGTTSVTGNLTTTGSIQSSDHITVPFNKSFIAGNTTQYKEGAITESTGQMFIQGDTGVFLDSSSPTGSIRMGADVEIDEDKVIKFEGSTSNLNETTLTVVDPTADRTISLPDTTGTVLTTGDQGTITSTNIANGAIQSINIGANQVTSDKFGDGSITTAKINDSNVTTAKLANNAVTTAKIAADAITNAKIADDSIDSEHYVDGSIDTAHIASDAITNAKIANDSIDSEHYVDGSIDTAHIADAQITTGKIVDSAVTSAKIATNAVTDAEIATGTLDNRYFTETELTGGALDGRYYTETESDARYFNISSGETIKDGDVFPDNDTTIATTAAINDRIIDIVNDVGGFDIIASEQHFPNTNPQGAAGSAAVLSIKEASGNLAPSGTTLTITNGNLANNANITITGVTSTIPQGFGFLVESTGTLHTYTFHRLVPKATEVTTVAGNITNINAVANNASNINSAVSNESNINAAVSNASNINSAVSNESNINAAVSNASNINAAVANASNINSAVSNESNINTVVTNISNVTSVANALDATQTLTVTVQNVSGSNVYFIDGVQTPVLFLARGSTYIFDQSASSNSNHPLLFRTAADAAYTSGVTTSGTAGSSGATVTFVVPDNAPNSLKYYCSIHGNSMGANITVVDDRVDVVATNITNVNNTGNSIANVNTVASNITDVTNVSTNISDVNNFADVYQIAASNPSTRADGSALQEGDLYFNSTANELKVYNGGAWQGGVTATGNFAVTTGNTFTGDNVYQDNAKLKLGTGSDLEIFHNASDSIINDAGTGNLKLQTGGSTKLEITSTGATVTGNLDVSSGVDVTGNITVSGTVDGIDIATDVAANTAKVTNATHTGDVTGATSLTIANDAVTTAKIVDDAVTTAKIVDDAVTTAKIVDDAVTQAKIAQNAVGANEIQAASITTSEIASGTIIASNISAGAVGTTQINTNAVTTAKIAADAVTNAKIADDSIDSEHYVDGSIDTAHIGDDQVTTAKIADNAITPAKLEDTSVTAGSYGSSTAIPALTVDAQGRITSASTNSVNTTTNLGTSTTTTAVTVTSSSGTDAVIGEATGSAAGVMSVADHDKLANIEDNATADQSASEILTLVKTVDGSGSGLDADTLDGYHSSNFATAHTHPYSPSSHSHSYASTNHSHSGYASAHSHPYASSNHSHSYAASSHSHSDYSGTSHNHDSSYAGSSHSHSYAATNHTHTAPTAVTYANKYGGPGFSYNFRLIYASTNNVYDLIHGGTYMHFGTSGGNKGVTYNVSDATLKENITDTTYDATSVIKNLRFVDFDWKEDNEYSTFGSNSRETCGVIAQEIELLDDSFTFQTTDRETGEKGVRQIVPLKFMTVSAKAIQELITKVETLEAKVAALEAG